MRHMRTLLRGTEYKDMAFRCVYYDFMIYHMPLQPYASCRCYAAAADATPLLITDAAAAGHYASYFFASFAITPGHYATLDTPRCHA